jgi:hypothetical protein
MPARIIAMYTAAAVFLGLRSKEPKPNVEDLIVNSFNKSHQKWIANGWVEEERHANQRV